MQKEKPLVFYFKFFDRVEEASTTHGFTVRNPVALCERLGADGYQSLVESIYDEVTERLEGEYGVHDWSTRPNPAVNAIGYTTYEVDAQCIAPLMQAWHQWFKDNGGKPTAVTKVELGENSDDLFIHDFLSNRFASAVKSKPIRP